jgi:hypothetical protein
MTEQTEQLARLFETPPRPSQVRFAQAYLMMATEALYRPAAPGDGMGNVNLSDEELEDHNLLLKEAVRYATRFHEEEDSLQFHIGLSNYVTNRAFVFTIEAARCLAGGNDGLAAKLLEMAMQDVEHAAKMPRSEPDEAWPAKLRDPELH